MNSNCRYHVPALEEIEQSVQEEQRKALLKADDILERTPPKKEPEYRYLSDDTKASSKQVHKAYEQAVQ
jgi:hypothetical protein